MNASQGDGATALPWASHWNDLEMADLLLGAGANVNAKDQYAQTPWSAAANVKPPGKQLRTQSLARRPKPSQSTVDLLVKLGATPVTFPPAERQNAIAGNPAQ